VHTALLIAVQAGALTRLSATTPGAEQRPVILSQLARSSTFQKGPAGNSKGTRADGKGQYPNLGGLTVC